ncbi:MAG: hypothetical protein AB7O73_14685 [Bacteroidia bacterium]
MPFLKYIFALAILLISFSCKKYFSQANEAIFLKTDQIEVITKPGQGYGSHKITDIWLYTNGFYRGAFPVGSNMPLMLEEGKVKLNLFAGIKNNGISDTRINWLFYEPIEFDTVLPAGTNFTRKLSFKYRESVTFKWLENFELPGVSLVKSPISDTNLVFHTNDEHVFEGNKSVEFGLSGSALRAQFESAVTHSLPLSSGNVYLELDYKSNSDFFIGIESNSVYTEAIQINAKENWNKIYIQLADAVNADKNTAMKKIIFRLNRSQSISEQKVYIDNIKLIYI